MLGTVVLVLHHYASHVATGKQRECTFADSVSRIRSFHVGGGHVIYLFINLSIMRTCA